MADINTFSMGAYDDACGEINRLTDALREAEAQRERAQQGWAWALTERHRERGRAEIAEAQRDEYKETGLLPEEVVQLQVDHDSWMRLEAAERGRAEALAAALREAREQLTNWHRMWDDGRDYTADPPGDDAVLQECAATEGVIATIDRALAGEPQAIDGDCGLTVEQQAEEARSQAEYAKRREGL